jgi:hypothetical protein
MKYFSIFIFILIIGCNPLPKYKFIKEYTKLNYGFTEEYKSDTDKYVSGMRLNITGVIDGEGTLLIIHPPYENGYTATFKLKGNLNINVDRTDWYEPKCLIKFIPNNELVNGAILIKIRIY